MELPCTVLCLLALDSAKGNHLGTCGGIFCPPQNPLKVHGSPILLNPVPEDYVGTIPNEEGGGDAPYILPLLFHHLMYLEW